MRKEKTGLYLVIILITIFGYVISDNAASSKFAAKVNGAVIENTTLDSAFNSIVENQKLLGLSIKEEDKESLRKGILEELISAELLYQESKKAGLEDLSGEIDERFENIKKEFSSDGELKETLKKKGLTIKTLKDDIRKGVYIQAFLDRGIYSKIVVTEKEKRELYEESKNIPERVRASHILIRAGEDAAGEEKTKAKEKIEILRKRVLSGEDFAELAKENSEDGSAPRGGDLGYFVKGEMLEPFEKVAFTLKKGEISEVFETPIGYHIMRLLDRKPAHTLIYEEVEDKISMFLFNQRRKEELEKFVETLKKGAKIERY